MAASAAAWAFATSTTHAGQSTAPPAGPVVAVKTPPRAFLDSYCVSCHNARLLTAGLALDTIDVADVGRSAAIWEKVVKKLESGAMPPAGARRPDTQIERSFLTYLVTSLDHSAAALPNPGRRLVTRLNRAEYANAIRDLLALEVDPRSLLPADDSGFGFDNIADVLTISPGLLERYMSAARRVSRLAVGHAAVRPVTETYKLPVVLRQDDRMGELMPFGSRGGLAVQHYFPADGQYIVKITLQRTWQGTIRGLDHPNQLDVFLDRNPIAQFTVGGECASSSDSRCQEKPSQREFSEYEQTADAGLEIKIDAKAGTRLIAVAFRKDSPAQEGKFEPAPAVTSFDYAGMKETDAAIDRVEIRGPYQTQGRSDTASRDRIFVCTPKQPTDEDVCARKILSSFARRAYRRPVTEAEVQTLLGFYKDGRSVEDFEAGIEAALRRVLVSVNFLFRVEQEPSGVAPGTPYRLNDLELASRLSFFLWSSIPDDELLTLAERNQLGRADVLAKQVQRMLADERATALVKNFAGQWLFLRNVRGVVPDPEAFPDFDDNLREALQTETELLVRDILRRDTSVLEFLRADYTFVNERLAKHYGIPGIYGSHFRRVSLNDTPRRGLLGHGSILTVTSYATRTSPVLRGKWLLENILGAPPPPPPPNVPALAENDETKQPRSVRERMEQHRRNPTCASCHARMDPLGFALENFDAIGRWRTSDAGSPIDASGALPDGTKFQGPEELRKVILGRGEEFVNALTEKLLTYALGRGVEYYDAPAIRTIVREAAGDEYRWSTLILGVAKSTPFQMRSSQRSQ